MIIRKRPLINMRTSLENIPREWLVNVEPWITRGQYLPCWLWMGEVDEQGNPFRRVKLGGKLTKRMIHRYVAKMFYEFPDEYYVPHIKECKYKNCLHPAHLFVTPTHPRWG